MSDAATPSAAPAPALDPAVVEHTTCRSCGGALLPLLSLGALYLSDFPHSAGTKAHPPVPLDLAYCENTPCGLVQLVHTTPAAWMYTHYWYRSGTNETMCDELKDVVTQARKRVDLPKGAIVMDIGANDGTLLAQYPEQGHGLIRVAYEPAVNLYEACRPHATVLYPEFFAVAEPWDRALRARIVTTIAMFYDLDAPHTFVKALTHVLHPEGVWIIQQAYLPAMLANTDVSNIVHEHLEYYSLRALERLLRPYGLEVVDMELRAINGGSFRAYVRWKGAQVPTARVAAFRADEAEFLADPAHLYATFAARAGRIKYQLQGLLQLYADEGATVDLYAASTKANTLLQWAGIDARLIRQCWERSPEKVGRYAGVSAIPIVSEAEGRGDPPAALLVGAWAFKEAFIQREAEYLAQGGRLVFPLPVVEIVEQAQDDEQEAEVGQ